MTNTMDTLLNLIVLLVGLGIGYFVITAIARRIPKPITVYENEAGLKFEDGKLTSVLGPGRYRNWREGVSISRLDLRDVSMSVAGQDVLTADNMNVRVSAAVRYRIADAAKNFRASSNAGTAFYEIVQIALRRRVGAQTLDALLADRASLEAGLAEELGKEAEPLGYAVSAAAIKDITLAGPAKQAFADLWKAQKEGLAALERARGEQAALRTLANAARMLKGNPELMNLRVLQALTAQPGRAAPSVILGGAPGLVPVSPNADPGAEESA